MNILYSDTNPRLWGIDAVNALSFLDGERKPYTNFLPQGTAGNWPLPNQRAFNGAFYLWEGGSANFGCAFFAPDLSENTCS